MKQPELSKGQELQLKLFNYGYDTNKEFMKEDKVIELTEITLARIADAYLTKKGYELNDSRLISNERKLVLAVETKVRPTHQKLMQYLFGEFKLEFQVGWLVK